MFLFTDSEIHRLKATLKRVDDMKRRISVDLKGVYEKLSEIELNTDPAYRNKTANTLSDNFGLLIDDVAQELTSIADTFKPTEKEKAKEIEKETKNESQIQRSPASTQEINSVRLNKDAKNRLLADTTDSDESVATTKKDRKTKHRRRKARTSKDSSVSSKDESIASLTNNKALSSTEPSQPLVVSQTIEDLYNSDLNKKDDVPTTSADSRKDDHEDDFLGFEGTSEIDIGIKTELLQSLESEPPMDSQSLLQNMTGQSSTKSHESLNGSVHDENGCDNESVKERAINENAIVNGDSSKGSDAAAMSDEIGSTDDELLEFGRDADDNNSEEDDDDDPEINK